MLNLLRPGKGTMVARRFGCACGVDVRSPFSAVASDLRDRGN
jgi:hypothetical protein